MAVTSPRMLKWGVIPKYKSIKAVQGPFPGPPNKLLWI